MMAPLMGHDHDGGEVADAPTMRGTPGFVAYYFLETDDGVATITITEDEAGTTESMSRAANWVQQNLESRASLGSPEVTTGEVLLSATR